MACPKQVHWECSATGNVTIPTEIVNPNTGAIVAIKGIRDSSGYSGWHGFLLWNSKH